MLMFQRCEDHPGKPRTSISLKAARVNAGLTQNQAAEAIGVPLKRLLEWENNPGEMQIKYLDKIEEVYNYPINNIYIC